MKDKKTLKEKNFFHSEIVIKVFVFIIVLILFIGFYVIDYFIFKQDSFDSYGNRGPVSLDILLTFIAILMILRKPYNFLVKKIKKLINYNETGKNKKIMSFCINFTAVILILIILSLSAILLLFITIRLFNFF